MPSGSKEHPSLWRVERSCDEAALDEIVREWLPHLKSQDVVLLEGPMGSGKSTFAKIVLAQFGVDRPPEGSPTFSLMHEYTAKTFPRIVHVDLYRLEEESELRDSGIEAAIWEDRSFALLEWADRFPHLFSGTFGEGRASWRVTLDFSEQNPHLRTIKIDQLSER